MNKREISCMRKRHMRIRHPAKLRVALLHDRRVGWGWRAQLQTEERNLIKDYRSQFIRWFGTETAPRFPSEEWAEKVKGQSLRIASLAGLSLEIGVSALISPSVLNLPVLAAIGAGVGIALTLTLMIERGLLSAVYDEENPQQSCERLTRIGTISAGISLLMLIPFFLARGNANLAPLAGFSLGIMGLSLPFAAGGWLAASELTNWARKILDQYRTVRAEQARVEAFILEINLKLKELQWKRKLEYSRPHSRHWRSSSSPHVMKRSPRQKD